MKRPQGRTTATTRRAPITAHLGLKPTGRGGWAVVSVTLRGWRLSPVLLAVGNTITMQGTVWRIVSASFES